MSDKKNDDYVVPFSGVKLNRSQANRVGFTLVCGFVAAIVLIPTISENSPLLAKVLVFAAGILGYLFYGRWRGKT
jgi:hypothetical protein